MSIPQLSVVPQLSTEKIPQFDTDFWPKYPRHTAKKDARKMWDRLTEKERTEALLALPAHIKYWNGREVEFIPHAATWINGRRFEDELPSSAHVVIIAESCARCGGSTERGFVKRRDGNVCLDCETERR